MYVLGPDSIVLLQYFKKTMKLGETAKKLKTQIWSSVVTIVLVEGIHLLPMDDNGLSDPYIKFRLGNEKYKSKVSHVMILYVNNVNMDQVCSISLCLPKNSVITGFSTHSLRMFPNTSKFTLKNLYLTGTWGYF